MKLGKCNWKYNWNPLVQTGIGTQRFPVDKCDHSDTKSASVLKKNFYCHNSFLFKVLSFESLSPCTDV